MTIYSSGRAMIPHVTSICCMQVRSVWWKCFLLGEKLSYLKSKVFFVCTKNWNVQDRLAWVIEYIL